jgi:excinuclease ABC subunit B
VDDVLHEIRKTTKAGWRTLVTTLTKRSSEELTTYLAELGVQVRYLHSEIDAIERMQILRDLRLGTFDVLVGINLLREGLDLPEVALVAVLDADKEGFLRSTTSLVQTCGRAARNVDGRVILYADKITDSMQATMTEVERRREKQLAYNAEQGIVPETIIKPVRESIEFMYDMDYASTPELPDELVAEGPGGKGKRKAKGDAALSAEDPSNWGPDRVRQELEKLRGEMFQAATELRFEDAAKLRDRLKQLEELELKIG